MVSSSDGRLHTSTRQLRQTQQYIARSICTDLFTDLGLSQNLYLVVDVFCVLVPLAEGLPQNGEGFLENQPCLASSSLERGDGGTGAGEAGGEDIFPDITGPITRKLVFKFC